MDIPHSQADGEAVPRCPGGAGLRSALHATLDKLAKACVEPDEAQGIHAARKAIKEYRALLRLVDTGEATALRHDAAAVARVLSPARDRQTCLDTLSALCTAGLLERTEADIAISAFAAAIASQSESASPRAAINAFASRASDAQAAHLDRQCDAADLEAGLQKAYEKACDASDWSDPTSLHELRKRVVILRYQMSLIARLTAGFGGHRAKRLQHLRDVLGWHQDLETLKMHCRSVLPAALAACVRSAIRRGQKEARHDARRLHGRLFAVTPKRFSHRIVRHLHAGR